MLFIWVLESGELQCTKESEEARRKKININAHFKRTFSRLVIPLRDALP